MTRERRPGRWRKVGIVFTIIATILFLATAVCAKVFGISDAAASYNRNRDAAQKAGLWFSSDQVKRGLAVNPSDNCGPMWMRTAAAFSVEYKSYSPLANIPKAEFLYRWDDLKSDVEHLRAALDRPRFFQVRALDQPYELPHPGSTMRNAIAKRIAIALEDNDKKTGEELLNMLALMAIHADDDPAFFFERSQLTREITKTIRRSVATYGYDAGWRKIFQNTLDTLERPVQFAKYIRFEHWSALWTIEIIFGDSTNGTMRDLGFKDDDSVPTLYQAGRHLPLVGKGELSRFHEYYAKMYVDLPKDPNDIEGLVRVATDTSLYREYPDMSGRLTEEMMGTFNSGINVAADIAKCRALQEALAIIEAKSDPRKGLPLQDFHRLDIDGKPLRLVKHEKGWDIYSVGPNRTDDAFLSDDYFIPLTRGAASKEEWKRIEGRSY